MTEMVRLVLAVTLLIAQAPSASALFREGHTGYIGIRYWLQTEDGSRLTEAQAQPGKRYSVQIRSNVAGLLMVFVTADGSELTSPTHPPYGGMELRPGSEFTLPGTFRLVQDVSSERLVFLFARSQTEMVRTAVQAMEKLGRLGPSLVSETVAEGAELGTYVVNRHGNPSSATMRMTR
jgi:hypothetical protein